SRRPPYCQPVPPHSERIAQCELNYTRITCLCRNRSECSRRIALQSGVRKIRMVEYVEELRAELQVLIFPNFGVLAQCQVRIELAGAEKNANAGISEVRGAGNREWNQWRIAKCALVDVAGTGAGAAQALPDIA